MLEDAKFKKSGKLCANAELTCKDRMKNGKKFVIMPIHQCRLYGFFMERRFPRLRYHWNKKGCNAGSELFWFWLISVPWKRVKGCPATSKPITVDSWTSGSTWNRRGWVLCDVSIKSRGCSPRLLRIPVAWLSQCAQLQPYIKEKQVNLDKVEIRRHVRKWNICRQNRLMSNSWNYRIWHRDILNHDQQLIVWSHCPGQAKLPSVRWREDAKAWEGCGRAGIVRNDMTMPRTFVHPPWL